VYEHLAGDDWRHLASVERHQRQLQSGWRGLSADELTNYIIAVINGDTPLPEIQTITTVGATSNQNILKETYFFKPASN